MRLLLVIFKHCERVSERKLYGKASGVETEEVLEVGSALVVQYNKEKMVN